jgi:hypothetical protein
MDRHAQQLCLVPHCRITFSSLWLYFIGEPKIRNRIAGKKAWNLQFRFAIKDEQLSTQKFKILCKGCKGIVEHFGTGGKRPRPAPVAAVSHNNAGDLIASFHRDTKRLKVI